jgi:UDP-N-acetylmuramoylalanine--D-glutamate ligase
MKEAVKIASKISKAGDVVLLSPAAASFGLFKNYKDRGQQFAQAAKALKNK